MTTTQTIQTPLGTLTLTFTPAALAQATLTARTLVPRTSPRGRTLVPLALEVSMPRVPVVSSNLKSVGYDPTTRDLDIEFKNGAVYRYENVEPETYAALMAAESIGQYFTRHVKNGYSCAKLAA